MSMTMDDLRDDDRYLDIEEQADLDLNALLKDLTPNLITPHLEEVLKANPAARGNVMARYILRGLVQQKGKIPPVDILHKGEIHTVRFLDVSPLCEGPWAAYSLTLLPLSFGEQCTVIETLYPEAKQLPAKAFAALFSPGAPKAVEAPEEDVLEALGEISAGIAMILARLKDGGPLHADSVGKEREAMADLAKSFAERKAYKEGFARSQQKAKKGDKR